MSCGTSGNESQSAGSQATQSPGAGGVAYRMRPAVKGVRGPGLSLSGLSPYDSFADVEAALDTAAPDGNWQTTQVRLRRTQSGAARPWQVSAIAESKRGPQSGSGNDAPSGAASIQKVDSDTATSLWPSAGSSPREVVFATDTYEITRCVEADQPFDEIIRAGVAELVQSDIEDWQGGDVDPDFAHVERRPDGLWATVYVNFARGRS